MFIQHNTLIDYIPEDKKVLFTPDVDFDSSHLDLYIKIEGEEPMCIKTYHITKQDTENEEIIEEVLMIMICERLAKNSQVLILPTYEELSARAKRYHYDELGNIVEERLELI